MKFCKDCKSIMPDGDSPAKCQNHRLSQCPVTGKLIYNYCFELRRWNNHCGPEGRWWEAKDETV